MSDATNRSAAGSKPTTRDRARTEQAIRTAAESCFAEFGYERATMRRIAQRAGVNPSLLIQYFGSKHQLFTEVVRIEEPVMESMSTDQPLGTSVADTFVRLYEGSRPWVTAALGLWRSAPTHPEAAEAVRRAIGERSISTFASHLDADDAEFRSAMVGAVILGIIYGRHLLDIEYLNTEDLPRLIHYCAAAIDGVIDAPTYLADNQDD